MNFKVFKIKGLIGYQEALDLQMKVFDLVDRNEIDGGLIILEHKPVLTMGIRTEQQNLLVSEEYLQSQGVELHKTDRGGDITFHGPGQIVLYPILRFRDFKLRLSDYMHKLEDIVIDALKEYGITGYSKDEFPGVWVDNTKICAIGVRAKKFIVYHGLAFNITTDKRYFNLINPCGITEFRVSSMNEFVENPDIENVKDTLLQSFSKIFDVELEGLDIKDI